MSATNGGGNAPTNQFTADTGEGAPGFANTAYERLKEDDGSKRKRISGGGAWGESRSNGLRSSCALRAARAIDRAPSGHQGTCTTDGVVQYSNVAGALPPPGDGPDKIAHSPVSPLIQPLISMQCICISPELISPLLGHHSNWLNEHRVGAPSRYPLQCVLILPMPEIRSQLEPHSRRKDCLATSPATSNTAAGTQSGLTQWRTLLRPHYLSASSISLGYPPHSLLAAAWQLLPFVWNI